MLIHYEGVDFFGSGYRREPVDDDRYIIEADGLDGFGSTRGGDTAERVSAMGGFAFPSRVESATRSVAGWVLATSWQKREHMMERLNALGADGGHHMLTMQTDSNVRSAPAQVRSVRWDDWGRYHDPVARFQVSWRFPDPWWHGEAEPAVSVPFGESGLVVNRGRLDAWPIVKVHGPTPSSWVLEGAGGSLRVLEAVPSGQVWTVDMESASVRRHDGSEVQDAVVGVPVSIPTGEHGVSFWSSLPANSPGARAEWLVHPRFL